MGLVAALTQITAGMADNPTNDMANWNAIRNVVNGNIDTDNLDLSGITQEYDLTASTGIGFDLNLSGSVLGIDADDSSSGDFLDLTKSDGICFDLNLSGDDIVFDIDCSNTATIFDIDHTGNSILFDIDASATSVNVIEITADSLTGGHIMYLESNSSDTSARPLVEIYQKHADATGVECLRLRQASTGDVIKDHDSGARLTAAGAWTDAGASEIIGELDTSGYIDKVKNLKLYNFYNEKEKYGLPIETTVKMKNGKKVKERKYKKDSPNSNAKVHKGFVSEDPTTPEELISRFDDGEIGISATAGVNFLLAAMKELIVKNEALATRVEALENA